MSFRVLNLLFCLLGSPLSASVCGFNQNQIIRNDVPTLLVVGPYYSKKFGQVANALGYQTIAIYGPDVVGGGSMESDYFTKKLIFTGDPTLLSKEVYQYTDDIRGLIPASEWATRRMNPIRQAFMTEFGINLPGNSRRTGEVTRNKALYYRFLARHGFEAPRTYTLDKLPARQKGFWPLVVKPPLNCGTTAVRICSEKKQVLESFTAVTPGVLNKMLEKEGTPLISDFLAARSMLLMA